MARCLPFLQAQKKKKTQLQKQNETKRNNIHKRCKHPVLWHLVTPWANSQSCPESFNHFTHSSFVSHNCTIAISYSINIPPRKNNKNHWRLSPRFTHHATYTHMHAHTHTYVCLLVRGWVRGKRLKISQPITFYMRCQNYRRFKCRNAGMSSRIRTILINKIDACISAHIHMYI